MTLPFTIKHSAFGSLNQISRILDNYTPSKILLVRGKTSYEACGAKLIVEQAFRRYSVTEFFDFDVNPKIEDADRGARLALDKNIDLILAIGGGSSMDMAKLIKAFMPNVNQSENIVRGKIPVTCSEIPLIAVPTTAGSGSEATHFAVVYIGKDKFSLASPNLLPTHAVLDGSLLRSVSPYQRAVNGLDALAQAIESCWSIQSTYETRQWSYQAIEQLMKYLPKIIQSNDSQTLQAVMEAANLAGQAINITKTTAPHALSYAFTSYYGIPHGHAVWLTLPAVFSWHMRAQKRDITDPRDAVHFTKIMDKLARLLNIDDANHAATRLKSFVKSLNVEPDMDKLGINTSEKRSFIASKVNIERLSNSPVKMGSLALKHILDCYHNPGTKYNV